MASKKAIGILALLGGAVGVGYLATRKPAPQTLTTPVQTSQSPQNGTTPGGDVVTSNTSTVSTATSPDVVVSGAVTTNTNTGQSSASSGNTTTNTPPVAPAQAAFLSYPAAIQFGSSTQLYFTSPTQWAGLPGGQFEPSQSSAYGIGGGSAQPNITLYIAVDPYFQNIVGSYSGGGNIPYNTDSDSSGQYYWVMNNFFVSPKDWSGVSPTVPPHLVAIYYYIFVDTTNLQTSGVGTINLNW